MHITDIMQGDPPTLSFEFFPPQTPEAAGNLGIPRRRNMQVPVVGSCGVAPVPHV
jgi:hypothetical protein